MNIREATINDIPAIQAIAKEAWPVAYTGIISAGQIQYMLDLMYGTSALQEQFSRKEHRFLLAMNDDRPIGFAGFQHGYRPGRSRLHKLYVSPDVLRKGVGHALLNAVLVEVRTAGDRSIELNVNKMNRAKAFYARHGFVVERDEVLDIGNGYVMDDHVMALGLPA